MKQARNSREYETDDSPQESPNREAYLEGLSEKIGRDRRALLEGLPMAELRYLSWRWDLWPRYAEPRRGARQLSWEMSAVERGKTALTEIKACAPPQWTATRMLDIGCGDGGFLIAMAHRGVHAHGVDLAEHNIMGAYLRGRSWQRPIAATVASATSLPYPAESFDAVTCGDVIEHVSQPLTALREIKRVLRPGGYLWLAAPTRYFRSNIWRDPHYGYFGISVLPRRQAAWYMVRVRRALPTLHHYEVERLPRYGAMIATLQQLGFELLAGVYWPPVALRNPESIQTRWKRRLLIILLRAGLRAPLTTIYRLKAELIWPIRLVCRKTG